MRIKILLNYCLGQCLISQNRTILYKLYWSKSGLGLWLEWVSLLIPKPESKSGDLLTFWPNSRVEGSSGQHRQVWCTACDWRDKGQRQDPTHRRERLAHSEPITSKMKAVLVSLTTATVTTNLNLWNWDRLGPGTLCGSAAVLASGQMTPQATKKTKTTLRD